MAKRYFIGTTDGDVGTAGNWSGTTLPTNGDDAVFPGNYVNAPSTGWSDLTAVALARLFIGPGNEASLGASGDPFDIGADEVIFDSGGEECWLNITGGNGHITVLGSASNDSNMLQLQGTMGTLYAAGGLGTITVANGSTLAGLKVSQNGALTVNVGTSVSSLALVEAVGGNVTLQSTSTAIRAYGSAVVTVAGAANPGTVIVADTARIVHTSSAGISSLLSVYGNGAVFDGSQNQNAADITIAAAEAWPGGLIDIRSGLDQYIFTVLRELGGQVLKFDKGSIAA